MDQEQRRQFVRENRICWVNHILRDGSPASTPAYYAVNDVGQIELSTMGDRGKARAVERGDRVSVSVYDERWPPTYLLVFGKAQIDRDPAHAADMLITVVGLMAAGRRAWWRRNLRGHAAAANVPASRRGQIAELARKEHRVVITLTPEETFETPPRHVSKWRNLWDLVKSLWGMGRKMGGVDTLTHWTSTRMPW